jgi:hypothetical protein
MNEFLLMLMLMAAAEANDEEIINETLTDAHDCNKCGHAGHCMIEPVVRDIRAKHAPLTPETYNELHEKEATGCDLSEDEDMWNPDGYRYL